MSGITYFRDSPMSVSDDTPLARAERTLVAVLCALAGFRYILAADVSVAVLISIAFCVVWIPLLRRFRLARTLLVTIVIAAAFGVALTALNSTDHTVLPDSAESRSVMLVSLAATIGLLLWGRARIGDRAMPIAFGIGMVAAIALRLPLGGNVWRFTLSLPLSILILAVAAATAKWWIEVFALVALAGVGLVNDARSNSAMLLLAAVIIAWQRIRVFGTSGRRKVGGVAWVGIAAVAVFFLVQSAILEGYFGEITQARTQAQIDRGGSVFTGGRPEMAASWALVSAYPFGLGSGIRANTADVLRAKEAMLGIGYDPNNNYVQQYLFGNGVEVHSLLGDFWLWFGLAGVAVSALILVIIVLGVDRGLRTSTLTALFVYLAIRFVWDLLFSPAGSSMHLAALAVSLAFIPVAVGSSHASGPPSFRYEPRPHSPF